MKKLLFTLLSIGILTSCSPRYSEALYKSDYTQYVKEGFYIYPEGAVPSVLDYTPLSSLSLVFTYGKPDKKISAPGITIIKDGALKHSPIMQYLQNNIWLGSWLMPPNNMGQMQLST